MAIGILMLKLLNVLQMGQFYDPEWSLVTFVLHGISFMFILFMVLHNAADDVSMISYLWGHIAMFVISSILFAAEALLWFVVLLPRKAGSERYGERDRLLISRKR